jgi:hypothetical protein
VKGRGAAALHELAPHSGGAEPARRCRPGESVASAGEAGGKPPAKLALQTAPGIPAVQDSEPAKSGRFLAGHLSSAGGGPKAAIGPRSGADTSGPGRSQPGPHPGKQCLSCRAPAGTGNTAGMPQTLDARVVVARRLREEARSVRQRSLDVIAESRALLKEFDTAAQRWKTG